MKVTRSSFILSFLGEQENLVQSCCLQFESVVVTPACCVAGLQEHTADSGAAVGGTFAPGGSGPARGEAQPLPGGTDRTAVRADAGVHQTQHPVQHSGVAGAVCSEQWWAGVSANAAKHKLTAMKCVRFKRSREVTEANQ